jgi:hypothetical protein
LRISYSISRAALKSWMREKKRTPERARAIAIRQLQRQAISAGGSWSITACAHQPVANGNSTNSPAYSSVVKVPAT